MKFFACVSAEEVMEKQSQPELDSGSPEESNLVELRDRYENELTEFQSENNYSNSHPHEDLLSNDNDQEYTLGDAENNITSSFVQQQQNNFYEDEDDENNKRIEQQKSAKLLHDAEVSSTSENIMSDENFW